MTRVGLNRLTTRPSPIAVVQEDNDMRRIVIRTVASAVSLAFCCAAEPALRSRSFHFDYKAIAKGIPAGTQRIDLWVPLPHDDAHQQIKNLRIYSPYHGEMANGSDGNAILHVGVDHPKDTFTVSISLDASRQEHVQSRLAGGSRLERDEDPEELARYVKPDRLVPLDNKIRKWARDVVDRANAHTDVEMARAIYNHVVSTVKYDKSGKGWGRGDIYYACEERRGNCSDFHAIFIGYARAVGIPARFSIGFPLPADRGEGKIDGYHCWAEFYAKGIGWVPVDASEAAKNPSKREYFFGAHDENRIELSKGRDIVLTPRQRGGDLNYFIYPYAEIDGSPFDGTGYEVAYRDSASSGSGGR
jgi:transglutaminase-like putative cysteine protease